jgi:hypothetical protein|nr:MAG TPA: Protein of unknown function (DUF2778) [Bacteriophage sp.]
MKLQVIRKFQKEQYTISNLLVDGLFFCNILEDKDRGLDSKMPLSEIQKIKVRGQTAIPTGSYEITMDVVSPKFKDRSWAKFCNGKLPRLLNVPGYEGVLIHVGNKPEDTDGCLLPGFNKVKGQVVESTATFQKLYKLMEAAKGKGEKLIIEITHA